MGRNDAVKIAPEVHSVEFEDDKIRVLDVNLPAGKKAGMHWHPRSFSYVVSGGEMSIEKPDGTVLNVKLEDGAGLSGVEDEHAVENIGITDIHTIQIEFKY
jgi:oxalate decarboxylase/phosphoglucose isomerase-like protein (cupin superfamily)